MSVVFVGAMFMSIMDMTIVNVALPAIGRDFHVSATSVGTVAIAYLVSLAVFIPASGWLGDRFGGRRILLVAIAVFTISSALCGAATSLGELAVFRVLQGAGGGMLAPVGMAMLYRVYPPTERVRAATILTVPTTLAPALGPVIGGLLVTNATWRWVFYVNVPIGIATCIFGSVALRGHAEDRPGRFDLTGFVLAGAGLGLAMYGVSEGPNLSWGSHAVLASIAAGAVLLAAMVLYELRHPQPIVALRVFGDRLFRSTSLVTSLVGVGFLGTLYAVSLYYQDGRGLSALQAGLGSFPEAIGVMTGAQLAGRVVHPRMQARRHIAIGAAGAAIAMTLLGLAGAHTSLWWTRLLLFALGFSMAQVMVPTQAASFATISPEATGRASTLFNAVRQLSGAVGVALLTSAIVAVGPTHLIAGHVRANLTAYHVAFFVAAGFAATAIVAAWTVREGNRITAREQTAEDLAEVQPSFG